MASVWWGFAFCSVVSCLMLQSVDMKSGRFCVQTPPPSPVGGSGSSPRCLFCTVDETLEGSSMGYLTLPHAPAPVAPPRVIRVSDIKAPKGSHAVVSRRKRNVLFPSGVKLCAQETAQQVVANHLSYFHLRGKTWTPAAKPAPLNSRLSLRRTRVVTNGVMLVQY